MMKMFVLAASAAALTFSMPVVAENPGKGAKAQQSQNAKSQSRPDRDTRSTARTRTDARTDRRGDVRTDRRGDIRDDRRFDRERHADRVQNRHNVRDCPPGLAKKNPPCIPPGQAKRMFNEGQRLPAGFNSFSRYNEIPERYRSRVPFSRDARYIYRDERVYVVNPTTRLVTRVIDLFR